MQILQQCIYGSESQLHSPTPLPLAHRHPQPRSRKVDDCSVAKIGNAPHTCKAPPLSSSLVSIDSEQENMMSILKRHMLF